MKAMMLLSMLLAVGCATGAISPGGLTEADVSALDQILSNDWSNVGSNQVRKFWPDIDFESAEAGDGCEGSLSLSRTTPLGARTFVFNRAKSEEGCVEQLSVMSFELRVDDPNERQQIGERLRSMVAGPTGQVSPDRNGYTVVSWPMPGINQTTHFTAVNNQLRFTVFRVRLER